MEQTELDDFIRNTHFTDYQKITLLSGEVIPGNDRKPLAEKIFPADFQGKTLLDVGCYYGFFLHEAIRRGASRAVGIEADPERFQIAEKLAGLWDNKVEVMEGLLEEVDCAEQFDFVTFLNVLHHVTDPILVMKKLTRLCKGTLIVEFRQPIDYQFLFECFHSPGKTNSKQRSRIGKVFNRVQLETERFFMASLIKRVPLIGIASVEYHRSYYFSPKAFVNTFQVHQKLFRSIEFRQSLERGQILAFCDCRAEAQ
jgi:SAM-dependent methyltransferase